MKFVTREPILKKQVDIIPRIPAEFFSKNGKKQDLFNLYEGQTCFLVLSGPSLNSILDKKLIFRDKEVTGKDILSMPGVVTMGVNNSPKTFRPNLWVMGDDVKSFIRSIWLDPKIMKFCPFPKLKHTLFDSDKWEEMNTKVIDCPNTWFFERNEDFKINTFLEEKTLNWGQFGDCKKGNCIDELGIKGNRSVMLFAIRILHTLGFKKVYLLGCDFKMSENYTYHFQQERASGSVSNNNKIYDALNTRFNALRNKFIETGFEIYNCNQESNLGSFEYKNFESSIIEVVSSFPDTENERTEGLYDRKANERKK